MYDENDGTAVFEFTYKDVIYAIFDTPSWPDRTITFLCKIPNMHGEGGAVFSINSVLNLSKQAIFDDNRILNGCYEISKRKILSKQGVTLGFEGRMLNYAGLS